MSYPLSLKKIRSVVSGEANSQLEIINSQLELTLINLPLKPLVLRHSSGIWITKTITVIYALTFPYTAFGTVASVLNYYMQNRN